MRSGVVKCLSGRGFCSDFQNVQEVNQLFHMAASFDLLELRS